jgi:hypothetical protein
MTGGRILTGNFFSALECDLPMDRIEGHGRRGRSSFILFSGQIRLRISFRQKNELFHRVYKWSTQCKSETRLSQRSAVDIFHSRLMTFMLWQRGRHDGYRATK